MPDTSLGEVDGATKPAAAHWPGFDTGFPARIDPLVRSTAGQRLHGELNQLFKKSDGAALPVGRPAVLGPGQRERLTEFVAAYHRMVETIVAAWRTDRRLRETLSMPDALTADLAAGAHPHDTRVHLARLDVLPQDDGTVKVLETNANCPGLLQFSGVAARAWRRFLDAHGHRPPEPLPAERELWMAQWFLRVAEAETGQRPAFVPLLREEGGNRWELDLLRDCFLALGVESREADLRELEQGPRGVLLDGRPVRHAYLKFGIQEFCRVRSQVEPFVRAVREGDLFVQNRQLGRWVGDNKLCLAVLSDPRFGGLFTERDRALVAPAIPWSRNIAHCPPETIDRIRRNPRDHVLKRPLDTRGRGVVIGRESDGRAQWKAAVGLACREGWLVQEYCPTPQIDSGDGAGPVRHDLALGAINGELSAVFMRTSTQYRVNVARTGCLHPVFA
ncbi:hypothetical protein [Streptomyces sp. NPDC049813]|uniref:hypothetical protein n=1 Tax=Streptomyces sp. NPDC049813 TaxID=3365597 RepID=UPI0037A415C3